MQNMKEMQIFFSCSVSDGVLVWISVSCFFIFGLFFCCFVQQIAYVCSKLENVIHFKCVHELHHDDFYSLTFFLPLWFLNRDSSSFALWHRYTMLFCVAQLENCHGSKSRAAVISIWFGHYANPLRSLVRLNRLTAQALYLFRWKVLFSSWFFSFFFSGCLLPS